MSQSRQLQLTTSNVNRLLARPGLTQPTGNFELQQPSEVMRRQYPDIVRRISGWIIRMTFAGIATTVREGTDLREALAHLKGMITISIEDLSRGMVTRAGFDGNAWIAKEDSYTLYTKYGAEKVVVISFHPRFTVELPLDVNGLQGIYLRIEFAIMVAATRRMRAAAQAGFDVTSHDQGLKNRFCQLGFGLNRYESERKSGWLESELGVERDVLIKLADSAKFLSNYHTITGETEAIGYLEWFAEGLLAKAAVVNLEEVTTKDTLRYLQQPVNTAQYRRDQQKACALAYAIGKSLLLLVHDVGDPECLRALRMLGLSI